MNPLNPLSSLCDGLAGVPTSTPTPTPSGTPSTITFDRWDGSRWRHYRATITPGSMTLANVIETDEIGIDLPKAAQ